MMDYISGMTDGFALTLFLPAQGNRAVELRYSCVAVGESGKQTSNGSVLVV